MTSKGAANTDRAPIDFRLIDQLDLFRFEIVGKTLERDAVNRLVTESAGDQAVMSLKVLEDSAEETLSRDVDGGHGMRRK